MEAQRQTEILRTRRNLLYTFGNTRLPYVFLGQSAINEGDVVKRQGEVTVEPPKIVAPGSGAEFAGFGLEELPEGVTPIILNRWVKFPTARYENAGGELEVVTGPLEGAIERTLEELERQNDIRTGVIRGPEDKWGFSLLGYVGQMIVRSTPGNIGEYFEHFGFPGDEE
jgi:hypothetical protein